MFQCAVAQTTSQVVLAHFFSPLGGGKEAENLEEIVAIGSLGSSGVRLSVTIRMTCLRIIFSSAKIGMVLP